MKILRIPAENQVIKAAQAKEPESYKWFNEPHPVGIVYRAPMIGTDNIPLHHGPSGKLVTNKREQREEWKRSGTCAWEKLDKRPRGLTDPRIARARGERVSEEAKEWLSKSKIETPLDQATQRRVRQAQNEVLTKHKV